MKRASYLRDRLLYRFRDCFLSYPAQVLRCLVWSFQGMRIGRGTRFSSLAVTWPHQVRIGNMCILEADIFFKFDGIWQPGPNIIIGDHVFIGRGCEFNIRKGVSIGNDCLLASGCKFIDHDHGVSPGILMRQQPGIEQEIMVESDVWVGANAIILKGVSLGRGCIVAAGAVVTRAVPPLEIWGGVPAGRIGLRT
jgi:acetyltransferase-like isoleucine patch superfamily enzyme